jgi:tetratricopeptide (TPR) repeat protein
MKLVHLNLTAVFLILMSYACAPHFPPTSPTKSPGTGAKTSADGLVLFSPCSREQAERWAAEAESDPGAGLRAANCLAFLAENGEDSSLQLTDAKRGRELAEGVANRLPQNGLAHYLAAYLTGLEAERDTFRGLDLVPVIEREAQLAAGLAPGLDFGGPDRMLGELYLRAPGFPVSIGDPGKAVEHFRRAVAQSPRFAENRLGLVKALLEEENFAEACHELKRLLMLFPPDKEQENLWRKALELMETLCSRQSP